MTHHRNDFQIPEQEAALSRITLGYQQDKAMMQVSEWLRAARRGETSKQIFRLFGYAGTGKTTLAKLLAADLDKPVTYGAYTGKAALMMEKSGCEGAGTIHSHIYRTSFSPENGGFIVRLNRKSSIRKSGLIVIDEGSMVDEKTGKDLESFGIPILVLGDPAQLPPVTGKGYFTESVTPDVMLTEIHRQAADNPIIRFATDVRMGRELPFGEFGTVTIAREGARSEAEVLAFDQIIVGRNATRESFNRRLRRHLGRKGPLPEVDDKLVCLRNDMKAGVLNGGIFRVRRSSVRKSNGFISLSLINEDFPDRETIEAAAHPACFTGGLDQVPWTQRKETQEFDYGYALTGHKSQGSQWANVIAYDESRIFGADANRWLYTAITRAAERLTLIRK